MVLEWLFSDWMSSFFSSDLLRAVFGVFVLPLLGALDSLRFASRHLHPLHFAALAEAVAPAELPLREGRAAFREIDWPARLHDLRDRLDLAADAAVEALEGLHDAGMTGESGRAYRALRLYAQECEALWPVARLSPAFTRCFPAAAARPAQAVPAPSGG